MAACKLATSGALLCLVILAVFCGCSEAAETSGMSRLARRLHLNEFESFTFGLGKIPTFTVDVSAAYGQQPVVALLLATIMPLAARHLLA